MHTFIIALGFPGGLSFGLNFLPLVQSQLVLTFWHNLWLHMRKEKSYYISYNTMLLAPLDPFLRYISHESISVSVSSKGIISRLNPLMKRVSKWKNLEGYLIILIRKFMPRETCKYTVIKRRLINHQKLCDKFSTHCC